MNRRPPTITIVGWLFILVGAVGLVSGLLPLLRHTEEFRPGEAGIASFSRILAIVGGVGILYGRNWARWLLVVWMIGHIGVAAMHDAMQVLTHAVIFTLITVLLFTRPGSPFFRPRPAAD